MRAPWVIVGLLLLAVAPIPAAGVGGDATCSPGGPEVTATSGAGDPQLPTLVYAALKTGFRAAVLWETEEAEIGRLSYALNGGSVSIRSDATERTLHLFVIDGLAIGRAFCFTPLHEDGTPAGLAHAFLTRNAMNAYDGSGYTINYLALANQVPNLPTIQEGLGAFAANMWDATDGNIRIGRAILVVQDPYHDNSGWTTCYLASVNTGVSCTHIYDVIFSYDTPQPGLALAATYRDGIQQARDAIWMSLFAQGGYTSGGDVGGVLMHEMGHYVFGAQDLYGTAGQGPNCWDPVTEISIMGNHDGANEFDDSRHQCAPDTVVPLQGSYVPSYTWLRQRFGSVPDRLSIDPGPVGDGGAYALSTLSVIPPIGNVVLPPVPQVQQDDAGSGGDAGSFPTSAAPIQPGILYDATLLSPIDGSDMYRFDAPAGTTVEIAMYPRFATCFGVVRPDGSTVPGACAYDDTIGAHRSVVAPGGPLYLRFALGTNVRYQFGVGFDAAAPGPL